MSSLILFLLMSICISSSRENKIITKMSCSLYVLRIPRRYIYKVDYHSGPGCSILFDLNLLVKMCLDVFYDTLRRFNV